MNTLARAFRTTCVPQVNRLDTTIPNEYVGKKIEIIVVPLDSIGKTKKQLSPPHINTIGWKFNREEANER